MKRTYPDEVAGPFEPPPRDFEDRKGRPIAVREYGEGPIGDREATEGGPERTRRPSSGGGAADDEFEALVEMYVAFDPADRAQGIPPSDEDSIRDWLDTILAESCLNVVAWHGYDAVGHATLVPDGGDAYELAIFVLHTYQEAGIGTELMEALLGLGRERGVERVWLTVERWNRAAVSLYEKVGFEPPKTGGFELEMTARLR